jgi:DNA polymerase-3 subunit delta
MAPEKPSFYLLYGDDELAFSEQIAALRRLLGGSAAAELNTTRFTPKELNFSDLETACNSLPFLAKRRLIIIAHAEMLPKNKKWQERFSRLLDNLPESTALLLIEHVQLSRRDSEEKYRKHSFYYQWALNHPQSSWIKACITPRRDAFARWITKRCLSIGGEIKPAAAHLLAELVADDSLRADQELHKLLDYVDYQRPIDPVDVESLTTFHGQADVFRLVDSLGHRDGQQATACLHRLLEDQDFLPVFGMIVRQFRLLLQTRQALDRQEDPARVLKAHPYLARKIIRQSRNFTTADLRHIYSKLHNLDVSFKTEQPDPRVELDTFIAELMQ